MLTLAQLRTVISETEALQYAIDTLSDLGFNATAWQSGSWQLAFLQLFTKTYAGQSAAIKTLAEIAFNDLGVGDALTALSDSVYDNQRYEATRAIHTLRFTAAASAGPYTLAVGGQIAQETATGTGLLYVVSATPAGSTLNPGSTLDVTVECQTAGAAGNVAVGTITKLLTPLAGVTVTNPNLGGGTSILSQGTDEELDAALRQRNRTKWAAQNFGSPAEAYEYWCRQGSAAIVRVKVDDTNPRGAGTVDVYVAGASGVSGGTDVTDGETELDKHLPATSDTIVYAAAATAIAFSANVYVTSTKLDAAKQAEIEAALTAFVNGVAIGGKVLPPPDGDGSTGYLLASEWQGAVTAIDGVENIGATVPAANTVVAVNKIATVASITFTYVAT